MNYLDMPVTTNMDLRPIADDSSYKSGQNRRQLVFGPPSNYVGPRPPMSCELYITNLPTNLNVSAFLQWLGRLGNVYQMRIMMNTVIETRGYCFVRFFEEKTAIAAFELLSFLFLNGKRPNAQISQCKRQLFVGGIPKSLSPDDIRCEFKKLFSSVTKCVVFPERELSYGVNNRGFAFLNFPEHDAALEAKRFLKYHRLWGQFIKIDWARSTEANESSMRLNNIADFRKNDYSAKLRLYALANNWHIPIIVYGSNFKDNRVQYGGVLLKDDKTGNYSCIIVEVIGIVFDIHVLLCEIATHLVEVYCGLPQKHFIVRTRYGSTAKILYSFLDTSEMTESIFRPNRLISTKSALELMTSLEIIAQYSSEVILKYYKTSFCLRNEINEQIAKFALIEGHRLSYFYSIYPKYRNNYPLNNNFNDTEIVLLQAVASSNESAFITPQTFEAQMTAKTPDEGAFVLNSQRYNRHQNYVLNYVDVEMLRTCAFYNPMQQVNTPPLWVRGNTYQASVFESSEN